MQQKVILTPNFSTFCVEMQEAFEEGFKLDFDNLPHASFIYYEAELVKDDVQEDFTGVLQELVVANGQEPVKRVGRNKGM